MVFLTLFLWTLWALKMEFSSEGRWNRLKQSMLRKSSLWIVKVVILQGFALLAAGKESFHVTMY